MRSAGRFLKPLIAWEARFVLASTFILACLYFLSVPFLELMELKAWDLHFAQRGKIAPPSGLMGFVAIDEESVNRDGRWPWPRRQMARLLQAVDDYGARVIGLDLGFFEPDLKLRQRAILDLRDQLGKNPPESVGREIISMLDEIAVREDDDVILAETIRNLSIPLVLGHFFYAPDSSFQPILPPPEVLDRAAIPIVQIIQTPSPGRLNEAGGLETNIPIVLESTPYTGSFNVYADPDGSVRSMPLVIRYENRYFPSLALQTLSAGLNLPPILKVDERGVVDVRLGPVSIPTNDKGEILVNFYGPGYTFPHFSASALMHHEAPEDALKGRFIIIGNTTMGLHDMRPTPFGPVYPGVELHCTVMENIVNQQFLARSERSAPFHDLVALLGMGAAFLILQSFLLGIPLAGCVVALLGIYIGMTHYFFLREGIWLNHVFPSLSLVTIYLGTTVHHYLKEEREKRMVRGAFSLYVPGSVMEEMLAHPERLRLGGEKRELTVLFSDIRGFTSLSEVVPPEELVPQLNHYLTRMTQVVFDHHGTLDKYIGDAVMAIFGAPVEQEDHAVRACGTALKMIGALGVLQKEWEARGLPVLQVGIGINTGLMMVGNMGSERRFDYTVLGDNVNLASRLEGLTKMYGVSIVVSETTWEAGKGLFVGRELDVVRVKGKQKPVAIYQIMALREEGAEYLQPLAIYADALDKFRKAEWAAAASLFAKVEELWPGDAPSALYGERCRGLLSEPGCLDDWSYVTILDHK